MSIHNVANNNNYTNMLTTKTIAIYIAYTLGIPMYTWAFLLNIGSVKSDILFVVALLIGLTKLCGYMVTLYYKAKRSEQDLEEKEIELKSKRK